MSLGCASYRGSSRAVTPSAVVAQGNWVIVPRVPRVLQHDYHDCGAAALASVLDFWGRPSTPEQIAQASPTPDERLRAGDLERYARMSGLSSHVFFGTINDIMYEVGHGRPIIVGVGKPIEKDKAIAHYEVVVGFNRPARQVLLLDPANGWQEDTFEGFAREWAFSKAVTIVVFPLEPARHASR